MAVSYTHLSKMSFGNKLGVRIEHSVDKRDLFTAGFGDIVAEVPADKVGELGVTYTVIGEVTESGFAYGDMKIDTEKALKTWEEPLAVSYTHLVLMLLPEAEQHKEQNAYQQKQAYREGHRTGEAGPSQRVRGRVVQG